MITLIILGLLLILASAVSALILLIRALRKSRSCGCGGLRPPHFWAGWFW